MSRMLVAFRLWLLCPIKWRSASDAQRDEVANPLLAPGLLANGSHQSPIMRHGHDTAIDVREHTTRPKALNVNQCAR
jgi:hypothetical protein